MIELLQGWQNLLADARLPRALNGGYRDVVRLLGDVVDEWAKVTFPPYLTAVQLCTAVSVVDATNCNDARLALRDQLIAQALKLSGLSIAIKNILKMWRLVPQGLKTAYEQAMQEVATYGELLSHPSAGALAKTLDTRTSQMIGVTAGDISEMLTNPDLKHVKTWALRVMSSSAASVADVLTAVPAMANQINRAGDTVIRSLFGDSDVGNALITAIKLSPIGLINSGLEEGGDLFMKGVNTIGGWVGL
jgi:hypothetical protein